MMLSEQRKGELYIYIGDVLWAFFPIITVFTYAAIPSFLSLAWSTLFAGIVFGGLVVYKGVWRELRNPLLWKYTFYVAFFIGIVFYALYFKALEVTTPGNVAIIALFEVFTSYVFFTLFRKERFSREHTVGSILMVVGAAIVLARDFTGINMGDILILIAVTFTPIGNYFQKKTREFASTESIMFLRCLYSVPAIFILAAVFNEHASFRSLYISLPFLLINGVLLLGLSKILWVEAIHRISVTKGVALSSVTPIFTLLLAWLFLAQVPTPWQLVSLFPLLLGTLLLTDQWSFTRQ